MRRLAHLGLLCFFCVATAQAEEYWIGEGDQVFGEVRVVEARFEDTFVGLARTHNVGFEELKQANPGVDAWLPGEGTKITIPSRYVLPRAAQRGIVVNIAELRLYYFPEDSRPPPEGVALGLCSGSDARKLFFDTVEQVIVPGLEMHGIPAARAWSRVLAAAA